MTKEARPWVKLWKEETGAFAQLPFVTRAIASEMLKFVDDRGRLFVGDKHPADAIAFRVGATKGDRRLMRAACDQLHAINYFTVVDGWLHVRKYRVRQYGTDGYEEQRTVNERLRTVNESEPKCLYLLKTVLQDKDKEEDTEREKEEREVLPAAAGESPRPNAAQTLDAAPSQPRSQSPVQESILGLASPPQTASAKAAPPPDVAEVFEHWKTVMSSPRSLLDGDRERVIKKALKNYSVADCKLAIDGCAATDWNMGRDPNSKKKFNGIDLILRNSENIERFMSSVPAAVSPNEDPPDYSPAKHGEPKSARNYNKWNEYIKTL